jgi:DNA primase
MDLRIMTPPDGLDPADYLAERGGEAFKSLLAGAVDALEHKIRTATAGIDLARDTHRANQALEDILTTIARGLPAGSIDSSGLRAQQLLARLARQFVLEEADVRARFNELRRKGLGARAREDEAEAAGSKKLEPLSLAEKELLEILVLHPELAPTALSDIADDDLASPTACELFGTYRRLEESGQSLEFNTVLAEIEDPQLKHLLVEIDDLAHEKAQRAMLEPPDRLRSVIRHFHQTHELRELRNRSFIHEQEDVNLEIKTQTWLEEIAAKRRQQGISAHGRG